METPADAQQQHFLFVTSPLQGHINPVLRLAARVRAANPRARVTLSTTVSGHRRMFPHLASSCPDEELTTADGMLHAPYSDGYDSGFDPGTQDVGAFQATARVVGGRTLSGVLARLAARGHPATRVVYTFLVDWALDVARQHGVPAALFWIQPATVLAVYYHYFHGHAARVAACATDPARAGAVELPGLAPLGSAALPTIVAATSPGQPLYGALTGLRGLFTALDEHPHTVLVNTFEALELDALRAVPQLQLAAVGPVLASSTSTDLVKVKRRDGARDECVEWLDALPARSVVYVSFGTMLPASKRQELELARGLEATNRPYLWARGGTSSGAENLDRTDPVDGGNSKKQQGKVVAWCDQTRVLSHPAVGCFVTHCGWNSVLESISHGVPVVAMPQWTDQPTVAWLVVERVCAGVRAAVDGEGVAGRGEITRCVDTVMGGGTRAAEIWARAARWMVKAKEAVADGGTSGENIRAFALGLL